VLNSETIAANFKLRVPGWVRNEVMDGDLYKYTDNQTPSIHLTVNGENVEPVLENGYITLEKHHWQQNDKINISFEMPVRKVASHDLVVANKGKMALERGPIVYCAEEVDNPKGVLNILLPADEKFTYSFETDLLGGLGKIESPTLTAIPYYAWAHRGNGEMAVWINETPAQ
jgi:DUF1680 family protein